MVDGIGPRDIPSWLQRIRSRCIMSRIIDNAAIEQSARQILSKHTQIGDIASLSPQQDLYAAGLTSFAAVQVMLALEGAFDLVFPAEMLNKRSFQTLDAIVASVIQASSHRKAA